MLGLPSWLLWAVGAWVAYQVLRFATMVKALLDLELRPARFEIEPEAEVPAAWRAFLEGRAAEVEAHGLARAVWVRHYAAGDAPAGPARHGLLFGDGTGELSVLLAQSESPDAREPHTLSFVATYTDGTWLHGINGLEWAVLGVPPSIELVDPYAPSFGEFLRVLRARHAERAAITPAQALDVHRTVAEWNRLSDAVYQHLDGTGFARARDDRATFAGLTEALALAPPALRMTLRAAVRGAAHIRSRLGRLQGLVRARREVDGPTVKARAEVPPELEVETFLRFEAAKEQRPRRGRWLITFAVTGVAFVASLLHWVEPEHTLVLAAAVLLHELGHFAAMRAFGYRDARIFFVPFFGAAASGSKKEVSLAEELIVLFAGPVPGIVLAVVLLQVVPSLRGESTFQFLLFALIGLNGFNLLPIYPLDGGKIVDALLFARRPLLVFVFRGGAAMLLLAGALYAEDPVLGFLGVVVGLGLSSARRAANLEREVWTLRRRPEHADADVLLLTAITARKLGLATGPVATRLALFRHVRERAARGKPSLAGTAGWILLHLLALGGSVIALMEVGMSRPHDPVDAGLVGGRAVPCERAREELDAAIAHVIPARTSTESVLVTLRCELTSEEATTALGDDLAALELTSNITPVRPPWIAPRGAPEDERTFDRTRHTYARLRRAERELSAKRLGTAGRWYDGARAMVGGEGELRQLLAEREARLDAWVDAQSVDERFDVDLARMLVARPGVLHGAPERLGLLPTEEREGRRQLTADAEPQALLFFGLATHEGALTTYTRARDRRAILGLADHLCRRGCTELRYVLRSAPLEDVEGGPALED